MRRSQMRRVGPRMRRRQDAWAKVRAKLEVRSGGRCEACRFHPLPECSGRFEHAHHVLPRSRGGQDVIGNASALGRVHHDWVHGHPFEARALGLLR